MTGTTEFIIGTEVSCTTEFAESCGRVVVDPVARPYPSRRRAETWGRQRPPSTHRPRGLDSPRGQADLFHLSVRSSRRGRRDPVPARRRWAVGLRERPDADVALLRARRGAVRHGRHRHRRGHGHGDGRFPSHYQRPCADGGGGGPPGEHVFATDGAIGRVQGLVIDPSDHCVTHVLLDEGAPGPKRESPYQ